MPLDQSTREKLRKARPIARKPKIALGSFRWLEHIDRAINGHNVRGPMSAFRDIAADLLDGWASRKDLDDLIKRRLLQRVCYGFDDSLGRDPLRDLPPWLCGSSWSVNLTERAVKAFGPDRLKSS